MKISNWPPFSMIYTVVVMFSKTMPSGILREWGETCWMLLAQIWLVSNLSQQHPTCCNTSQHGGQTHAICCPNNVAMLRWHVAIVWKGLKVIPLKSFYFQTFFETWRNEQSWYEHYKNVIKIWGHRACLRVIRLLKWGIFTGCAFKVWITFIQN